MHANCLFNHYLAETGDLAGLELLPLFLSCRAAIRAKTDVTAAVLRQDDSDRQALVTAAGEYLRMAMSFLAPDAPRLIAIGGVSGSGKSTVAKRLAPSIGKAPGAVILRSDEIRKQLFHVDPLVKLGAAAYTADVSRAVYQILTDRAALVLTRGQSVVVDAVFADPAERSRIEQVAAAADVPFSGIWLQAPADVLARRAERRSVDASDADIHVIRAQLHTDAGPIDWSRVDSAGAIESVVMAATDALASVQAGLLRG